MSRKLLDPARISKRWISACGFSAPTTSSLQGTKVVMLRFIYAIMVATLEKTPKRR